MVQEKKNQKVDYKIKSDKRCKECGELLKQNVVNKNPYARLCYVCFKISKGKKVVNKYRIVNGVRTHEIVKTINLLELQARNKRRNNKA